MKRAIAIGLLTLAGQVQAVLTDVGGAADDYSFDSLTGLNWLHPSITIGTSAMEAQSTFGEWRHATRDEVMDLFSAYGPLDPDSAPTFASNMGGFTGLLNTTPQQRYLQGIYSTGPDQYAYGGVTIIFGEDYAPRPFVEERAIGALEPVFFDNPYARGGVGNFMVQVAPVPEPATYAMMALGLAVVGWTARRRKAKA